MSFKPKDFNWEIRNIRRWIIGSASKRVNESCLEGLKALDEGAYNVSTPSLGEKLTCSMINKFKKETLLAHRQAQYRKYYDECTNITDFYRRVKKAINRLDYISVREAQNPSKGFSLLLSSDKYQPSVITQIITGLFGKSAFTFRQGSMTDSIFVDFDGGKFSPPTKVSTPESIMSIDDALTSINKKIMESREVIDSANDKIKELQKDIDALREEKWKHEEIINNIKGKIVW